MIIEGLFNLIFGVIIFIISFIPSGVTLPDWAISFYNLISKALYFFPPDVFTTIISVVVANTGVQFVWAIVEWVYKKIPGVE